MESASPDPLDTAWAEVEAHWEDPAAHKKFLALAETLDRLADAGRRYRAVRENDASRAERAKTQIDALFGIAMSKMKQLEKTEPPKARRRLDYIAFGISAALIAAAIWSMFRGH